MLPRAAPPLALMALIFYLSAQPDPGADVGGAGRLLAHAVEYAALAALWSWALVPWLGRRAIVAAVVISLLYAVTDELHQASVPGRDADPLDVLTDAVGIALACFVTALAWRRGAPAPDLQSRRASSP